MAPAAAAATHLLRTAGTHASHCESPSLMYNRLVPCSHNAMDLGDTDMSSSSLLQEATSAVIPRVWG